VININGLTSHQVELLDAMWAIDEYDDLTEWMETLSQHDQEECLRLQRLVVLAQMDEDLENKPRYDEAVKALDKIMR
jgi:hypothetical protein